MHSPRTTRATADRHHPQRRLLNAFALSATLAGALTAGVAWHERLQAVPAEPAAPPVAHELAWNAVEGLLPSDVRYAVTVQDLGARWLVTFEPEARARGGGARVTVDKASLRVVDVVPLR